MNNIKNRTKTILFASILTVFVISITPDIYAEKQDYEKNDIYDSFDIMEKYVQYDQNKNITFDLIDAIENPNVSSDNIVIAIDFANYNNALMNAKVEYEAYDISKENVSDKLQKFKDGRFKKLFESDDNEPNRISSSTNTKVIFVSYVDDSQIYEVGRPSPSNSNLACGGNYDYPHSADSSPITNGGFASKTVTQTYLGSNGYHQVAAYASWGGESTRSIDYAKTVTSGAPSGCNNGPFRDQAIIQSSGTIYKLYDNEPNPEVLSYTWPKLWWGSYVEWWHDNF